MAKKENDDDDKRPIIIIKKIKKSGSAHHGGSWKVAYADFVTAMMAFFLLLWLLSVSTEEQKEAIATYFAPTDIRISENTSGSGGLMGGTTLAEEDAMSESTPDSPNEEAEWKKTDEELDKWDEKAFKSTQEELRQAFESVPELQELSKHLLIDMTPEGLRIQIVDQKGKPMFPLGSAVPLKKTVKLLSLIAGVISTLPNKISIRGHTDSKKYGSFAAYTNWELSADRSNASRRVMLAAGLDTMRIENVQGKADREPLFPTDLDSPRNRRISIILLKQSIILGAKRAKSKLRNRKTGTTIAPPTPKKLEEGVIYFP
ncbi:MAG: flagellar motor protein MotB [Alphaproteobacteria bacterium]|nr:flagellar motor protein MotB [Alphaproteobacteria bacterium]